MTRLKKLILRILLSLNKKTQGVTADLGINVLEHLFAIYLIRFCSKDDQKNPKVAQKYALEHIKLLEQRTREVLTYIKEHEADYVGNVRGLIANCRIHLNDAYKVLLKDETKSKEARLLMNYLEQQFNHNNKSMTTQTILFDLENIIILVVEPFKKEFSQEAVVV